MQNVVTTYLEGSF